MPPIKYDMGRLTNLAKARDQRRTLARAANDEYQGLREQLNDLRRRASVARANATALPGAAREGADEEAARLDREAETVRSRMAEIQREIDATGEEAAEAARLVSSCLRFCKAERLEIPASLKAEADRVEMQGAM